LDTALADSQPCGIAGKNGRPSESVFQISKNEILFKVMDQDGLSAKRITDVYSK
jgi:hypothetical protein